MQVQILPRSPILMAVGTKSPVWEIPLKVERASIRCAQQLLPSTQYASQAELDMFSVSSSDNKQRTIIRSSLEFVKWMTLSDHQSERYWWIILWQRTLAFLQVFTISRMSGGFVVIQYYSATNLYHKRSSTDMRLSKYKARKLAKKITYRTTTGMNGAIVVYGITPEELCAIVKLACKPA